MMDMTQSMCDIIYDICGYDKIQSKTFLIDKSIGQRCFMELKNAYVNG